MLLKCSWFLGSFLNTYLIAKFKRISYKLKEKVFNLNGFSPNSSHNILKNANFYINSWNKIIFKNLKKFAFQHNTHWFEFWHLLLDSMSCYQFADLSICKQFWLLYRDGGRSKIGGEGAHYLAIDGLFLFLFSFI